MDEVVGAEDVCLENESESVCGGDADLLDLVRRVRYSLDGVCAALDGGAEPVDTLVDALCCVEIDVVYASVGVVQLVCRCEDGDHVCEVDEGVVEVEHGGATYVCRVVLVELRYGGIGVGESPRGDDDGEPRVLRDLCDESFGDVEPQVARGACDEGGDVFLRHGGREEAAAWQLTDAETTRLCRQQLS